MRIAIDGRPSQHGRSGIGVYVSELVGSLARHYPQHVYVVIQECRPGFVVSFDESNVECVSVAPSDDRRFQRELWEQLELPLLLKSLNIDVYHATNYVLPSYRTLRCATVLTLHDASVLSIPQYYKLMPRMRMRHLIRRSARVADAVVTVSQFTLDEYQIYFGERFRQKARVIHLALPTDLRSDSYGKSRNAERRRPYILTVGAAQPRKNVERLIAATELLGPNGPGLVVVGNIGAIGGAAASAAESLRRESRYLQLPKVSNDDLSRLYEGAVAVVTASLYEGFGLPILEAFSFGVPVLASNIPAHIEVGGEAIVTFDPRSTRHMTDAIATLISDPVARGRLAEAGHTRLTQFSWRHAAAEHMAAYEWAVAQRAKRRNW